MFKNVMLSLICVVIMANCVLAAMGHKCYVLRFDLEGKNCKEYLARFDTQSDELLGLISLPEYSGYNNFVVDEKGGCYISEFGNGWLHGRDIHYYDAEKKRIEHFFSLKDMFGPRNIFLNKGQLIVEITGNDKTRLKSGIIFIDCKTRCLIKKIFFMEDDPKYSQANVDDVYYDGGEYLFVSTFYMRDMEGMTYREASFTGDIIVVDVEKKAIAKIIKVPIGYALIQGVCRVKDKVYVAPQVKGKRLEDRIGETNDELLVFSLTDGRLLKTLKVSGNPYNISYDQSVDKIYVMHRNDGLPRSAVEVIDVKNDEITKTLDIPSQLMFSVVEPGKMYITVGESFMNPTRTKPALLVLDTKTDEIVKTIYGDYKGISFNMHN